MCARHAHGFTSCAESRDKMFYPIRSIKSRNFLRSRRRQRRNVPATRCAGGCPPTFGLRHVNSSATSVYLYLCTTRRKISVIEHTRGWVDLWRDSCGGSTLTEPISGVPPPPPPRTFFFARGPRPEFIRRISFSVSLSFSLFFLCFFHLPP